MIIVTGAAGFIGSSLCHWLIDNTDHIVLGIDNLSGGYEDNLPVRSDRFWFFGNNIGRAEINNIFEILSASVY